MNGTAVYNFNNAQPLVEAMIKSNPKSTIHRYYHGLLNVTLP